MAAFHVIPRGRFWVTPDTAGGSRGSGAGGAARNGPPSAGNPDGACMKNLIAKLHGEKQRVKMACPISVRKPPLSAARTRCTKDITHYMLVT